MIRHMFLYSYRKVSSDKCEKGETKYLPSLAVCPTIKPHGLTIESVRSGVVTVGKKVNFTLLQEFVCCI